MYIIGLCVGGGAKTSLCQNTSYLLEDLHDPMPISTAKSAKLFVNV